MPNLDWNLEKRETLHKEDIQELEGINNENTTLQMFIHMIIFIYSYILLIQDIVSKYTKTAAETVKQAIRRTENFSRTSWTKIQEETQARLIRSRTCQENYRNQSYRSYDYHSGHTTTQ